MKRLFPGGYRFLWFSVLLLFAAVIYRDVVIVRKNNPADNVAAITKRIERELSDVDRTLQQITRLIENEENLIFSSFMLPSRFHYFVFQNKRIIFWSDNTYTLNYRDILDQSEISLVHLSRGKFIGRIKPLEHQQQFFEIVVLIPLVEEFPVVNEVLQNTINSTIFTDSNIDIAALAKEPDYSTINLMGKDVFSIKFGATYSNATAVQRTVLVALILFAALSFGIFVLRKLREMVANNAAFSGLVFLVSILVALRSIMLLTRFPMDFVYLRLFDSKFYGSSLINPSLGDLILNLGSLLCIGLFILSFMLKPTVTLKVLRWPAWRRWAITAGCFFFSFFWLAVHHQIMKTLNYDSQWSMDLTQNLTFDYLKVMAFGVFFLSTSIYVVFTHISLRLADKLTSGRGTLFYMAMAVGIVMFSALGPVLHFDVLMVVIVNTIFILAILFFNLHQNLGRLQYLTFIYLFSFGVPGALMGLYANYQYRMFQIDNNRARLASQLLVERDFFTELQLADVANLIRDDLFIKQRINSPYGSKLIIARKIRNEYLNSLDKFDIEIYVFNSRGETFESFSLKDNYHDSRQKLAPFKTDIEGLFFVNPPSGQVTSRYIMFIEIEYRDQVIGYIMLDLRQKRMVPNSVFPLLTSENRYAQPITGIEDYSYGVFIKNQLQFSSGEFNYRYNMDQFAGMTGDLFRRNVVFNGFNHKAFIGDNNRFVIISVKEATLNQRLANFSFLFLVYLFTLLLILIIITIYQRLQHITLNYATRIQLYLNFAFFTPLIIVSITTVSIIIQTFKSSLEEQYLKQAVNLGILIAGPLQEYRQLLIDKEDLSNEIYRMAGVADLDINVFNTNGRLITSTLAQVYQNDILSNNIEPTALISAMEDLQTAFVQEDRVGLLRFKNAFVSVRSSESGNIIGILSLPFFASQRDLEHKISDVLSNIINIFTLLFLIFLLVSYFVSHGLTFPLRLITQKLKRTSLAALNEPLSWNSNDEIGLMVAEYNRMLVNLDESKKALAKTEKESAWREMARQVAHEIKNPLTPMKLTLQHMMRTAREDEAGENGSRRKQQINTLLEQIEALNDIATSFSDFAKMPAPKMELLDVRELLLEIIELYNNKELGQITTSADEGVFMVEGDRKWLGRAFANLIINGLQAAGQHETARIEIDLHTVEGNAIRVSFRDHGVGIPDHVKEKLFSPNFSTKYTGSGLGLAITKKGVEHANGRIWFESIEGQGATFYIEIPRAAWPG